MIQYFPLRQKSLTLKASGKVFSIPIKGTDLVATFAFFLLWTRMWCLEHGSHLATMRQAWGLKQNLLRMEGRKIREPRSLRASLNQHADILLCEKENLKHLITTTKNHLCSSPVSSVHGTLQARILEWVARHSLLQGISPTQGSNLGLLHCRQFLYCLSHREAP